VSNLGKAYVQIIPSAEGISGSISSVLDKESVSAGKSAGLNLAGGIGTALKGATSLVAGATVALTGAITSGAQEVASYGDNIDKLSQKMGISRQGYQEWEAVMQHSGTSMETMKSSMKTLANAVEKGNESFERIGISVDDLSNMSTEEIFNATIAGLQTVENESERTYLAGQLLGKGATELGALLNTSAEDTQKMKDRVHELGGVMSDDAVLAAATFQDNMQDLQTAISGVGRGMISELLPSMNDILAGFTELITGGENATELLSSGFESLFENLGEIAENIIETLTEMLPTIIDGIASILPDLIELATNLLVSLADAIVQALPTLLTTVVPALLSAAYEIVTSLASALIEAGPAILDAGKQLINMLLDSILSGNILENGKNVVSDLLEGITQMLPDVLNSGLEIILNLANGLLENLPELILAASDIMTQFIEFLLANLPTILEVGVKLIGGLITGILNNLPNIIKAILEVNANMVMTFLQAIPDVVSLGKDIVDTIAKGIWDNMIEFIRPIPYMFDKFSISWSTKEWWQLGKDIIDGIIEGLKNFIGKAIDAVENMARKAVAAARRILKSNSPSKEFMKLGKDVDEGFAIGIIKNADLVTDAVSDLGYDSMGEMQAAVSRNYYYNPVPSSNNKMDAVLSVLTEYLPEIAAQKGMDAENLYNGLNRQLGWALS
jgi:phage-related protein